MVIEDAHSSPTNAVQWHPSNPHWVLSASHDPVIRVHDLRRAGGGALHELTGHVRPGVGRCKGIYRPTFACGGRLVVSPGRAAGASPCSASDPHPKLLSRGSVEGCQPGHGGVRGVCRRPGHHGLAGRERCPAPSAGVKA